MPDDALLPILMIPIAFLCGAIPFSYLIGRAKGVDIRTHGSGNPGATNLGRVLGRPYFFLGFSADLAKGLCPTLLTGHFLGVLGTLDVPERAAWIWLGAMAASVLGHMYTPFLKFKGGKGVATGLGALIGVMPAMTIAAVGAFIVYSMTLALWRMVGPASSIASATLPVWVYLVFENKEKLDERLIQSQSQFADTPAADIDQMVPNHATPFLIVAVLLAVLVIYKHRANLGRAMRGEEPKLGERKPAPTTTDTPVSE